MVQKKLATVLGGLRSGLERSRKAVVAVGGLLLVEVGGRIGLPGLNTPVLSDYFLHRGGAGILSLYNWLVGGALTRGAVLALGIVPYISARIYIALAKSAFPAVAKLEEDEAGRATLRRRTRILTVGLAAAQSYGFARLVQTVPGAVAQPGAGFVVQTMLTLTAGAIVAMVLAEQMTAQLAQHADDDAPVSDAQAQSSVDGLEEGAAVPLLQPGPIDVVMDIPKQRETVNVPR